MIRNALYYIFASILTLVFFLPTTWATPFKVSVDISPLMGQAIELELDIFDNDGTMGNSHVLLDNLSIQDSSGTILGPGLLDFEDGTLQAVNASLDAGSILNVPGAFPGDSGSRQLRIDDTGGFPTIAFIDFAPSTATQLRFDFEFITPTGSPDSFAASLLDPITLSPLLPAGVLGPGDGAIVEATALGRAVAPGITATPVPEPSTLILLGISTLGLLSISYQRCNKRNLNRPQ